MSGSKGDEKRYLTTTVKSDGSQMYGVHTYYPQSQLGHGPPEYRSYVIKPLSLSGETRFKIGYTLKGKTSRGDVYQPKSSDEATQEIVGLASPEAEKLASSIYTNYGGFDRSLNYVVMKGQSNELIKGGCSSTLNFNVSLESFSKHGDLESYIGIQSVSN